ncbi:MAG TPA: hypothetical protein VEI96_09095 [Thermodesulfovibrionales bacterium]|nr:hypothetical protein [Thermodesulfovibrionales bacterium]
MIFSQKLFHTITAVSLSLCLSAVFSSPGILLAADNAVQVKKQPDIQQVKPRKPVKIKLHRTAKGEYSWDLTGDDVDEIVKADKKLRKLLKLDTE